MANCYSNAAYAYDFDAAPDYGMAPGASPAARPQERPRFDVYTGEGREASQTVSPAFTHVVKVIVALGILAFAICMGRVALAGLTAASLNANASLTEDLETAKDHSGELEISVSVYGADLRIRDIATGALSMVEPDGVTVLDLSAPSDGDHADDAASDSASSAAPGQSE